jgi:hypothetical protein
MPLLHHSLAAADDGENKECRAAAAPLPLLGCPTYLLLLLLLLLLQEGEAPEEVRAVLQQRSRWAKGHFQVFFSRHCPLFHPKLNMLQRVLYTNGAALCLGVCVACGICEFRCDMIV